MTNASLQASLLQERGSSSHCLAVTINFHKNVCCNTSHDRWNDGEDKTMADEAEKAVMAAEATATQEQRPS